MELADTMTTTKARLGLMNDGLQTTEELHEFEEEILCALTKTYPVQLNGEIIFRFIIANK